MTLRVTFLGTGGAVPTTARSLPGIVINRDGDRLLFDCGEGTQRQMMRFHTGFDLTDIFITHRHGDHVYGLPGLIETLDFNDRSAPLTIHAPPGTAPDLRSFLFTVSGRPGFPVEITPVTPGATVREASGYEVKAFRVDHDVSAVGYALVEDERKGRFDRERAEELGVPVGPKFSKLHDGEPVELEDGRVIEPEEVVGPSRPGRRVVYTGDTRPSDRTVEVAQAADLLIHDGTFADDCTERAAETGHSTARQAGRVAGLADARRLALVHISSRYPGPIDAHRREAREPFDGEVLTPEDGDTVDVPFP